MGRSSSFERAVCSEFQGKNFCLALDSPSHIAFIIKSRFSEIAILGSIGKCLEDFFYVNHSRISAYQISKKRFVHLNQWLKYTAYYSNNGGYSLH